MDEASDDEGGEMGPPKMPPQPPMPSGQPPLPKGNQDLLVRRDYDPKQARPAPPPQAEQWLTSPLTNEKIPAHKLQEHMKISEYSYCYYISCCIGFVMVFLVCCGGSYQCMVLRSQLPRLFTTSSAIALTHLAAFKLISL